MRECIPACAGMTTLLAFVGLSPLSAETRTFRGITEPLYDATISATVAGRVALIRLPEGSPVKKGEVILELEKDEQELEAARRKIIAESKAEVDSAKQQKDTLKLDYTATKQLFDATQSVSQEELWKKELDYRMAGAEYDRLRVSEERESLEQRIADVQLKQRLITAPFDGVVVKIHKHAGESANLQDPLVRVVNVTKCRFITHVEASTAPKLAKGMKVTLKIEANRSTKTREGEVEFASPVADPSSGLREVKILFGNPKSDIQPGVNGTLVMEE